MQVSGRDTGQRRMAPTPACGREGGFTIIELALAMTLFGIVAYVSMSLVTMTANTLGRVFAEYDSRKRVLLLHREMAEGGGRQEGEQDRRYGGYLAAKNVSFDPDTGVFVIEYPDFDDSEKTRRIEYVYLPDEEGGSIRQRAYMTTGDDAPAWDRLVLANVSRFEVCRRKEDHYTFRVIIGHRVKGFSNPIERSTEGQARNMALSKKSLEGQLPQCED